MDIVRHFKKHYVDEHQGPQDHDPMRRMISKILLQAVQEVCDNKQALHTRVEAFKWLLFDTDEHSTNMRDYAMEVTGWTKAALTLKIQRQLGEEKWKELTKMVTYNLINIGGR
jgi:hypothetical protein